MIKKTPRRGIFTKRYPTKQGVEGGRLRPTRNDYVTGAGDEKSHPVFQGHHMVSFLFCSQNEILGGSTVLFFSHRPPVIYDEFR